MEGACGAKSDATVVMNNGIHFISGLPRSGSTLLSALLRQNPRFHAHMSSPVAHIFGALQLLLSGRTEFHVFITAAMRRAILSGLFASYYSGVHEQKVIFDTNRSWSSKLSALLQLFPRAKIICCVRPLAEIVNSFERLIRANALEPSQMFNYDGALSVYTRVESLFVQPGILISSYNGLKEAVFGEHARAVLLLRYRTLASNPAEAMRAVYGFLEEDHYEHDFAHVNFDADEFDSRLGTPGLHRVAPKVEYVQRSWLLPPDIIARFENHQFWEDPAATRNGARVA